VRWDDVRAAIARADDVVASRSYADQAIALRDEDVLGLVPIGMNPVTKLWEFYHLRSAWDGKSDPAAIPIPRHAPDGSIAVDADTGIVFVLLPGATFTMGAQSREPGGPNFDPDAQEDETLCAVTLAPFFLARHELTRAQWQRLTGTRPFWWQDGSRFQIGPSHPAESIDWNDADRWLRRHGLLLPTDAQWEYGCRAGTTTRWWPGPDAADLATAANVHDLTSAQSQPQWGTPAPFTDGFAGPAPVASFRANPFGLYCVHGNVWEWCQDWYAAELTAPRPGDGLRASDPGTGLRVVRGGSYAVPERTARSAVRDRYAPTFRDSDLGVRPARALRP
jgi:formylglycine-generating enzyme required for sulfatase activity